MSFSATIHKDNLVAPFVQIRNEDWQRAIKAMTHSEFAMFLCLSSNADGYHCKLSAEQFEQITGFKKSMYYEAIKSLKSKGYLVEDCNGITHFLINPLRDYGITLKKQSFGVVFGNNF